MDAKILPLDGKYYGTKIEYRNPQGKVHTIELWDCNDYQPSQRELTQYDVSLSQWRDDGMCCDTHFESAFTYDLAMYLADCLHKYQYRGMTS